jgi:hypothetical protein
MKVLTIFVSVFLAVAAGGLACAWLLVSSCENSAHRTFDGMTQALPFPTVSATPSHPISSDGN